MNFVSGGKSLKGAKSYLAEGNRLIRRVMAEGLSITELPAGDLLLLVINSALYLGIGLIAFNLLLKTAKNRGLLGHY